MVYIRTKKIKGIDYAYLVESIWDPKKQTSRQQMIKYLGKVSGIGYDDIPLEYRNDIKITAFLSAHSTKDREKIKKLHVKRRKEIFNSLINGDLQKIVKIYERYSKSSQPSEFYEKLLKIVMYEIGDLWEKNKLSPATEHVASNVAHSLVKVIDEKTSVPSSRYDIIICTPEGEWHNLGCNIVESFLKSKGCRVFNLSPSAPHDSILQYIGKIDPDFILISVTLEENISSCQRLIKKIRTRFSTPIIVGGQAFKSKDIRIDATLLEKDTLDEIPRYLRSVRTN